MVNERFSEEAITRELKEAGATFKGRTIKCPFHEDRSPSGGVFQDGDGVWRYKCHAGSCGFGGDIFDVRAKASGSPLKDVLPGNGENHKQLKVYESVDAAVQSVTGTVVARYTYSNPETREADLVILRIEGDGKKRFLQISPRSGGFVFKAGLETWPIYNRIELQTADTVVVVEGEKCVHALRQARFAGTTSPCGAGKAAHADWQPLAGKKIYLWPDNDVPGANHMKEVSQILDKLEPAPTVCLIDPKKYSLPEHGDVVDFLKAFQSELCHSAIESVLEDAEPIGASRELHTLIEDTIAGRRESIDWPWSLVGNLTRALLPETVTLLCGEPGSAKSFLLLQAMAYWHEQGITPHHWPGCALTYAAGHDTITL